MNSLKRRALVILYTILSPSTIIFPSLDSDSRSTKRISGNFTARRHCVLLAHHVTGRGQPQLEQFPRTIFLTSKSPSPDALPPNPQLQGWNSLSVHGFQGESLDVETARRLGYLEHIGMLYVHLHEYTAFHLQLTTFPPTAMFCVISSALRKSSHTIKPTTLDSAIAGHFLLRHHHDYLYDYHHHHHHVT